MRAFVVIVAILTTFPNQAIGHSPECANQIDQYEQILAEIGEKNEILLSFSTSDEYNDNNDPAYIRIDALEFLDALTAREHLRLIRSVSALANCLHDNAHVH